MLSFDKVLGWICISWVDVDFTDADLIREFDVILWVYLIQDAKIDSFLCVLFKDVHMNLITKYAMTVLWYYLDIISFWLIV